MPFLCFNLEWYKMSTLKVREGLLFLSSVANNQEYNTSQIAYLTIT